MAASGSSVFGDRSSDRTAVAILAGSLLFAVFGQMYADSPENYFGTASHLTPIGLAVTGGGALMILVAAFGLLRGLPWARWLTYLAPLTLLGAFVPVLTTDPIPAGFIIAWQTHALGRLLTMAEGSASGSMMAAAGSWGGALLHLIVVAVLLNVAAVGLELSEHRLSFALCAVAHGLVLAVAVGPLRGLFRSSKRIFWVTVSPLVVGLFTLVQPSWTLGLGVIFEVFLVLALSSASLIEKGGIDVFLRSPALFIVTSYLTVIALGTLFLSFPAAAAEGVEFGALDAFFTAVSAVCVTGLAVVDTARDYSLFGQIVIMILIQVGGIGIIALSTVGAYLVAGNLGLRAEHAMGHLLDVKGARSIHRLIKVILISTLGIELIGATGLAFVFQQTGMPWIEAAWHGLFHAVSAFCNAGFSLQSNSLIGYAGNPAMLVIIAVMIMLGGIGFPTMVLFMDYWPRRAAIPLPVQARIVLWTTGILTGLGWIGFCALEWNGALGGLSSFDKVMNGLLQATSVRTAGFNSVPMTSLAPATVAMMVFLMFIGGAPGSTAGGIKVTTFALLLAAVPTFGEGKGNVTLFGRRITPSTLYRAISIVVVTLSMMAGLHFVLLVAQPGPYESLLFEAVSAVGTVGLSLGVTGELTVFGKYAIIAGMFAGRIGPLTAALVIAGRAAHKYRYSSVSIMVG